MSIRLFFPTLLLLFTLTEAACIPEHQTENRDDIIYELPQKTRYTGCVSQTYPNDRIMAYLYYKDGEATGEGTRWYQNGQKESEIIFEDGEMAYKRAWNEDGFLYESERYKDGGVLTPMEMPYRLAMNSCDDATFDDYDQWKLPSIRQLQRLPFSDELAEKTFIASNAPKKDGNTKTVSYMRIVSSEAGGRWDDHILEIDTPFHVVCIRSDDPTVYRLLLGKDGIADLDSNSERAIEEEEGLEDEQVLEEERSEGNATSPTRPGTTTERLKTTLAPAIKEVEEVYPVTVRGTMRQKSLREGYYIIAYTYSRELPTAEALEMITLAGYRYTTIKTKSEDGEHNYTLIGPFTTTNKAGRELRRIHERVEPNAYVVVNKH